MPGYEIMAICQFGSEDRQEEEKKRPEAKKA